MGKTPLPLTIAVVGLDMVAFKVLQDQGHLVEERDDLAKYDVILGPRCWRMLPNLLKYIPLALKEARAMKGSTTAGKKRGV